MFERSQQDLIKQKAKELIKDSKIGKVSRVYEHGFKDDDSNFEADVTIDGGTVEERVAPIDAPWTGSIAIPKVDDKVIVSYLAGEAKKPVISGASYTNKDRPPVGKAGMIRDEYESDTSPAGDGNLYFTGYTSYDTDVANESKYGATPEEVFLQWAKRKNDFADPSEEDPLPAKVEFYDAPAEDEAHITIELNKLDGSDSEATWGMKFDMKTGEVKLVDPNGYGIVSDGEGNFKWHYKSIDHIEEPDGGSLSL